MKYMNRETGAPVEAIQFTGADSVKRIEREFACPVEYRSDEAMAIVDDVTVKRGDYVIAYMREIIVKDPDWFNQRHQKHEIEMDLFEEEVN